MNKERNKKKGVYEVNHTNMNMVKDFGDANFEEEVLKSDKVVLVDIYADWCGPCKMMAPVIDEIAEDFGDKIKVGKVNSDENASICVKYDVMSIPNILLIKNGELVKRFIGVTAKEVIVEEINKVLE